MFGVAAGLDVTGRWLDRPDLWQPAGVIALLAVAWLVRQHQGELRWAVWVPLFAAIGAAELLIRLRWQYPPDAPVTRRSMAIFLWDLETRPGDVGQAFRHDLWRATPTLVIFVGLALAVRAIPPAQALRARDVVVTTVVAAGLTWFSVVTHWPWTAGVPELLVLLAVLAPVSLGWRRGPSGRMAATGVLLMVVPGLYVDGMDSLTGYRATTPIDLAIARLTGGVSPAFGVDTRDALVQALYLAGLALVAIACMVPALPETAARPG
jgi:hypothetical protein